MATISTTLKVRERKTGTGGGGGGPDLRYPRGGGGGGGGGDGDNYPNFGEQLRRYRLGLAVGLAAVLMLFVAFTSAYLVRQGLGQWDTAKSAYVSDWVPLRLPLGLLVVNTLMLLASSFTIEKARRAALQRAVVAPVTAIPGISAGRERTIPWLPITVLLGFGFLGGQYLAWREMVARGFFMSGAPSGSFFYLLTGMHALHLAGGIVALLYALAVNGLGIRLRNRGIGDLLERRRIVIDVTAWYWHFMALLWLYVFALLQFAS